MPSSTARPNRTDRKNLAADCLNRLQFQLPSANRIPPHFLNDTVPRPSELLIVEPVSPSAYSRFRDLPQPFSTMARRIDTAGRCC